MAEEHGCQAQEGHILCANNCGFFGSSATLNMCSKCYRDFRLKEEQDALAKAAIDSTNPHPQPNPSVPGLGLSMGSSPISGPSSQSARLKLSGATEMGWTPTIDDNKVSSIAEPKNVGSGPMLTPSAQPNRCLTCRKKVGLTGFKCRCGLVFCGSHRYPEKHGCTFDYKTVGKDAIAKANPVIKAEKLDKI
uniref:Zinc finger A20 and AN1 domain-containing stress-associated protein n=1 Tax=Suaeda glauca TaxID=397272 RepID=V5PZR5_9CARY|nr:zinc finger A20 and AN1 domain-containing stress-associated protein [Suaeda glauca]